MILDILICLSFFVDILTLSYVVKLTRSRSDHRSDQDTSNKKGDEK